MKKFWGGLVVALVLSLALSGSAFAQEQSGYYIGARFIYGLTDMDRMQTGGDAHGKVKMNSDTDDAFGGAFAVGYNFNPKFKVPLRAELEYSAFSSATGERNFRPDNMGWPDPYAKFKQDVDVQAVFVNLYYDEKINTLLTPYLTAGIGIAINKSKAKEDQYSAPGDPPGLYLGSVQVPSQTETRFAWNAGLGLAFDFTQSFSLDIGYRYVDLGSAKTKRLPSGQFAKIGDLTMHQFHLGTRYNF